MFDVQTFDFAFSNQIRYTVFAGADDLGVPRTTVTQIESGKRRISADELSQLSILFGVSADSLLHGKQLSQPAAVFARSFEQLSETDKAEIMNLIRLKEQMRARGAGNRL